MFSDIRHTRRASILLCFFLTIFARELLSTSPPLQQTESFASAKTTSSVSLSKVLDRNYSSEIEKLTRSQCIIGENKVWNLEKKSCESLEIERSCSDGTLPVLNITNRTIGCDQNGCSEGMLLKHTKFYSHCECDVGRIHWLPHNKCYLSYSQGPCDARQVLKVEDHLPVCVANLCQEGTVQCGDSCLPVCHKLNDPSCAEVSAYVDSITLQLSCSLTMRFTTRNRYPCPEGKIAYDTECRSLMLRPFQYTGKKIRRSNKRRRRPRYHA